MPNVNGNIQAGHVTYANNTTDVVADNQGTGEPFAPFNGPDFNGTVIFRAGAVQKYTGLNGFDGIHGLGFSGVSDQPGTGVVGFGSQGIPDQGGGGTGVRGMGGVFNPNPNNGAGGSVGGIGVHGIGGDGKFSQRGHSVLPGTGVVGVGGINDSSMLGGIGVQGIARGIANGVEGTADAQDRSGVYGFNAHKTEAAYGVFGRCDAAAGAGVGAESAHGVGVRGHSKDNDGLVGLSDGESKSGVYGFSSSVGHGYGVFGRCESANGVGASGFSAHGYGGRFSGGRAPLRLDPAATTGAPKAGSHQVGEFFVDSEGDLFLCKTAGAPGKWYKVGLTPA